MHNNISYLNIGKRKNSFTVNDVVDITCKQISGNSENTLFTANVQFFVNRIYKLRTAFSQT